MPKTPNCESCLYYAQEYEDYVLPVLTSFNGQPTVSPEGSIVYVFPELQSCASEQQTLPRMIA